MLSLTTQKSILQALIEDAPQGDITTSHLIPSSKRVRANILMKSPGIVCGVPIAIWMLKRFDKKLKIISSVKEGAKVTSRKPILTVEANARVLLTVERVLLNLLSHLSGIATLTHEYVQAVKGTKAKILDTRKTMPLWRELERYAVRTGGGVNHRLNLSDAVMIKDNHRQLIDIHQWVDQINAIKSQTRKTVIVEVDDLKQLRTVLTSRADIVLLDNMTPAHIRQAIALKNTLNKKILLEASGGITLKNVRTYATTGIDRISIGALTHSRATIDISLEICA